MILAIRTDSPVAELYLLDETGRELAKDIWEAGNKLSDEIHEHIRLLLDDQSGSLEDLTGLVAYKGPGSFTGLRIGLSVANAIAFAQEIPIVGAGGDDWLDECISQLSSGVASAQVTPEYGRGANITKPKK